MYFACFELGDAAYQVAAADLAPRPTAPLTPALWINELLDGHGCDLRCDYAFVPSNLNSDCCSVMTPPHRHWTTALLE